MANPFCWYELMTPDAKAAADFYGHVVGWKAEDMPGAELIPYTLFNTPDGPVGGMLELTTDMAAAGVMPGWLGYVAVEDVDAFEKRVIELGGQVHKSATDIPGVGRFAMAADPGGAVFTLFQPAPTSAPPPVGETPGHIGWRELMAANLDEAWGFYTALFGWTLVRDHDMGAMGPYRLFGTGGEVETGGMMTKLPAMPAAFWSYYARVDSVKAAAERLTAKGGKVVNGPMPVPSGDHILQAMDPQGAFFCLMSPGE